jgi:hypothetical protein
LLLIVTSLSQANASGWLAPGETLSQNQNLASSDGRYVLWMQDDGNLVLYGPTGALFDTSTNDRGVRLEMQHDGNLVIYDSAHQAVWNSATQGNPGAQLAVQNDGNLVLYAADRYTPLWSSNSAQSSASLQNGWLKPGETLSRGENLSSPNGRYALWMQDDGNLVQYGPIGALFATSTYDRGAQLEMQFDGNLVIYDDAHQQVWSSETQGNSGAQLAVQDDGNLVLYAADLHTPLWDSRSSTDDSDSRDPSPASHQLPAPTPDSRDPSPASHQLPVPPGSEVDSQRCANLYDYSTYFMILYNSHKYLEGGGDESHGLEFGRALIEFKNIVGSYGPLDLKTSPSLMPHAKCGIEFFGRTTAYDVPANLMYGMIGYLYWKNRVSDTVGFLMAAGGAAQAELSPVDSALGLLDPDDWVYLSRLDDECDSYAISWGADIVRIYGADVTAEEIENFLTNRAEIYLHDTEYNCVDAYGNETNRHPNG